MRTSPKAQGRHRSPSTPPHLPCHSPQSLPDPAVHPGPSPRGSAQTPLPPSTWSQPPGFPQDPTPPREDQGDRALPGPTANPGESGVLHETAQLAPSPWDRDGRCHPWAQAQPSPAAWGWGGRTSKAGPGTWGFWQSALLLPFLFQALAREPPSHRSGMLTVAQELQINLLFCFKPKADTAKAGIRR